MHSCPSLGEGAHSDDRAMAMGCGGPDETGWKEEDRLLDTAADRYVPAVRSSRSFSGAPISPSCSPSHGETPMPRFVVEGGQALRGSIRPAGNKNAALPAIAATLLTDEEVVLQNVPRIRDVETLLELLESLGC